MATLDVLSEGRVDLGIMARTDQVWPSDNTDPLDRMQIQDGFTQAYAPATMMAWVTDSPHWVNNRQTTLAFRFLSAMQGGLGIGTNLNKWQDFDFRTARGYIAAYKRIRETVQQGDLYRLNRSNDADPRWTNLYVAADKSQAALFSLVANTHKLDVMPAIALKQGFGRLIRSRTDRGVLALLDNRITKTRYGQIFFDSLPDYAFTTKREDVEKFFRDNDSAGRVRK